MRYRMWCNSLWLFWWFLISSFFLMCSYTVVVNGVVSWNNTTIPSSVISGGSTWGALPEPLLHHHCRWSSFLASSLSMEGSSSVESFEGWLNGILRGVVGFPSDFFFRYIAVVFLVHSSSSCILLPFLMEPLLHRHRRWSSFLTSCIFVVNEDFIIGGVIWRLTSRCYFAAGVV